MTVIVRPLFCAEAVRRAVLTGCATGFDAADMPYLEPELAAVHQRWLAGLRAVRVRTPEGRTPQGHTPQGRTPQGSYAAVWLEVGLEREVDAAWCASPSQGMWLHALAVTLCMQAVALLVPAVAGHGCAPVPRGDSELADCLRREGLPVHHTAGFVCLQPLRRYAVVTPAPWQGGCAVCALAVGHGVCPTQGRRESFSACGADSCAPTLPVRPGG